VGLVVEAFDRCFLDSAVHALDLAVGPWVLGLGEAMIDVVLRASEFKGVRAEDLVPLEHGLDLGRSPAIAAGLGEVRSIVGQDDVDFVGNGFDKGSEEVCRNAPRRLLVQLGEGKLRSPVDGHEEIKLAFLGTDLGDVDVEIADRIVLELLLGRLVPFYFRQAADAVALQAAMQRRRKSSGTAHRHGVGDLLVEIESAAADKGNIVTDRGREIGGIALVRQSMAGR